MDTEVFEAFLVPPKGHYNAALEFDRLASILTGFIPRDVDAPYVTELEDEIVYLLAERRAQQEKKVLPTNEQFQQSMLSLIRSHIRFANIPRAEKLIESFRAEPKLNNRDSELIRFEELRLHLVKKLLVKCDKLKTKKRYGQLLQLAEQGLSLATGNLELTMYKAEALWYLAIENHPEASALRGDCVKRSFSRALSLYEADDLDGAITALKFAYRIAPCKTIEFFKDRVMHIDRMRRGSIELQSLGDPDAALVNLKGCAMYITVLKFSKTLTEVNILKSIADLDEKLKKISSTKTS